MISRYLYDLFLHCPAFKDTARLSKPLLPYLEREVILCMQELNTTEEKALIDHLVSTPYHSLNDFFARRPLLEVFYLVNSLGEYKAGKTDVDELGRMKYFASAQSQIGSTKNRALQLMRSFVENDLLLSRELKFREHKSEFYLSHDIDSINGALLQDGMWALKHGRIDVMFKIFFQALMQRPEWLNMDLIMKTESEHGFKSAFYWIVNKGKIDARQSNADYYIDQKDIVASIKKVEANGFENGLHKSLSAESFRQELAKLPFKAEGNRYHYLKFRLPDAYKAIEGSGLRSDASLGFAEQYGFRNSYGYPFQPYNTETGKAYSFVEIPLNIMDGTFERYMKVPVQETAKTIISFLEENRENALLSILWHNTFFTNYKFRGYLQEYKKILAYLYENQFQCMTLKQITDKYSWKTSN